MKTFVRLCALWGGLLLFAQEAREPSILRPHDGALLPPGETVFIGRAILDSQLLVDGNEVVLERPGGRALTATFQLGEGLHQITLTEGLNAESIQVMAGFPGSPSGNYREFRAHPPQVACLVCHRTEGSAWSLRGGTVANSCLTCHDQTGFAARHSHTVEVLEECQRCHFSHGSKEVFHLRYPREVACKLCHK